jgi:sulfatase modifying factor 1
VTINWSANGYRLPTEAEWEYAAKGGKQSKGYKYSGSNNIDDVAWSAFISDDKTHPVGQMQANELGIYDLSGNIWEWCWDWYDSSYYSKSYHTDPQGADMGIYRSLRGGSWSNYGGNLRTTVRNGNESTTKSNSIGIRILRTAN